MDTKQYLGQIQRYDRMIKNKLDEIYKLRTLTMNISVSNDDDRVQTSSDKDKIGVMLARIIDMEREVDEIIDKRCEIVIQIEKMENLESYDILANIYILGKDLKVVAVEKHFSYRHFIRLYNRALKEFQQKYKIA